MRAYFFQNGIKQLAQEITGKENIYLGIRPYGFHAGNMLSFLLYPLLLSEEVSKLKKVPEFNMFIFINDWEQDGITGPDIERYPFKSSRKIQHFSTSLIQKIKILISSTTGSR